MFFDDTPVVFVDGCQCHDAGLLMLAPLLSVDSEEWLWLLGRDPVLDELPEIIGPALIDLGGIWVDSITKLKFGPTNAKEAIGISIR